MIPNSIREACNVISVNFNPISAVFHAQSNLKFDQSNLTGHEILVKMGVNSLRLHLYACLYIVWLSGQFGGLNLHGFTPNLTGQI